jgi:hypothetical protein
LASLCSIPHQRLGCVQAIIDFAEILVNPILLASLDPSLVFSEFMGESYPPIHFAEQRRSLGAGVIKGSEKALTCPEQFLDQKSYDSLSHRSQSTFASHRNTVYAIFQSYLKRKRNRGDYDAADR